MRLYRGMRNLDVTDDFMDGRAGGTEVAPMSTTTDISIAAQYGLSKGSLLFMIKVQNFMQVPRTRDSRTSMIQSPLAIAS